MSEKKKRIHPLIWEYESSLRKGKLSRRQFIRLATLLGMSAGAATIAAQCGGGAEPAAPPPTEAPSGGGEEAAQPTPTEAPSGGITRGGTFTRAMELQRIDHPARFSWVQQANVVRQVAEYLTETGPDNVTRPWLLEKWEASEDVKTWTLYLRQGVTFNNGDELTADDVLFNFEQWLDPDVGSSMLSLMSYLRGMQDVEKVDDYTIRLHLQAPNIGVPEHLFHYPANIVHRSFEGDFIQQPIGTGPFTLEEYAEGERAILKRREDYWKMGEDGQPLPYLDQITYVSMSKDAGVAAMQGGQVDGLYQPRAADWQALKDMPNMVVHTAPTAVTTVMRVRVDLDPWTDVRVRNALKMCQDREKLLQLSYYGQGDLALDAHVAPVHPSYCEKPIPKYDPERARELLAEAGYPDGLDVTLATKNDLEEPELAQAFKEQAAAGGFNISLDITEPGGYWERWTEVPLGMTSWTHRPLATMVLPLGYVGDENGEPVEWNESHWVDEEFSALVAEAEQTLDVEARTELMCQIEDIFLERGPIGISYWKKVWNIVPDTFHNVSAHPTEYDLLYNVWKEA